MLIIERPLNAGEVETEEAGEEEDGRQQKIALDETFNPAFELFLAFDVKTSIQIFILAAQACLRFIGRVLVPFHSDQVSLLALQLVDIRSREVVFVLARGATRERFLVWSNGCAQTANTSQKEFEVILMNVSHEVGDLVLILKQSKAIGLILVVQVGPLTHDQGGKDELEYPVKTHDPFAFDIAGPGSK